MKKRGTRPTSKLANGNSFKKKASDRRDIDIDAFHLQTINRQPLQRQIQEQDHQKQEQQQHLEDRVNKLNFEQLFAYKIAGRNAWPKKIQKLAQISNTCQKTGRSGSRSRSCDQDELCAMDMDKVESSVRSARAGNTPQTSGADSVTIRCDFPLICRKTKKKKM